MPQKRSQTRYRRRVETSDFADMMRRMIEAHGKRVADGDPEDLRDLLALAELLDDVIVEAIQGQMANYGISWTDVGRAAGITRQGARQRWGSKLPKTRCTCGGRIGPDDECSGCDTPQSLVA